MAPAVGSGDAAPTVGSGEVAPAAGDALAPAAAGSPSRRASLASAAAAAKPPTPSGATAASRAKAAPKKKPAAAATGAAPRAYVGWAPVSEADFLERQEAQKREDLAKNGLFAGKRHPDVKLGDWLAMMEASSSGGRTRHSRSKRDGAGEK